MEARSFVYLWNYLLSKNRTNIIRSIRFCILRIYFLSYILVLYLANFQVKYLTLNFIQVSQLHIIFQCVQQLIQIRFNISGWNGIFQFLQLAKQFIHVF